MVLGKSEKGDEIMWHKFLNEFLNEKEKAILNTVEGLDLTENEIQSLRWLAQWQQETVLNICSVINKAKNFRREI
jgi:hypothetical protein